MVATQIPLSTIHQFDDRLASALDGNQHTLQNGGDRLIPSTALDGCIGESRLHAIGDYLECLERAPAQVRAAKQMLVTVAAGVIAFGALMTDASLAAQAAVDLLAVGLAACGCYAVHRAGSPETIFDVAKRTVARLHAEQYAPGGPLHQACG